MFKLIKKLNSGVRVGEIETPHGKIETPFFMPVGTVGSVKGVSPDELEKLGAEIILSNTYHLYLRPGEKLIKDLGGLHQFMRWDKPILTDSGGYQVFSLGKNSNNVIPTPQELRVEKSSIKRSLGYARDDKDVIRDHKKDSSRKLNESLVKITPDGVEFKSHLDGSKHLFTPEKVIQIQLDLGVDILMPLDVCPSGKATKEEVKKACDLTIEWARRSKKYFDQNVCRIPYYVCRKTDIRHTDSLIRPLLHGIVQGGMYEDLRRYCAAELVKLDFDGYSVGGLAVDFETRDMWKIVKLMGEILPENKQRYLMGVGTPDDIIKATKLGMDMFDCVLPTRLARHGSVYVRNSKFENRNPNQIRNSKFEIQNYFELINLLNSQYRSDKNVLDSNCKCPACSGGFSKAYISHLVRSGEILGIRLTTLHNLYQYLNLMSELREEV